MAKFYFVFAFLVAGSYAFSGDNATLLCSCPLSCNCEQETRIYCNQKNLTAIPSEFKSCSWPEVRVFNISFNLIRHIYAGDFDGLPNLERLFLYDNLIVDIEDGAFANLSSLEQLSLDGNRLATLRPNVFKGLSNLKSLLLYTNFISSLPEGVFNGLSSLRVLALDDNRLTSLSSQMFTGLSNLLRLYIRENGISDLSTSPFSPLNKLTLLYISGNRLTKLTNTSLTGLGNLQTLLLRSNLIRSLSPGAFSSTPKLVYLYLDYNRIQRLPSGVFSSLANLQRLILSANLINNVEDGAFSGLRSLQILYLRTNRLQNITEKTFLGLSRLNELVMYGNQITSLPENTFRQTRILQRLWLQSNRIKCLSEKAFAGLDYLQLLHLAQNEISFLPSNVFQYTPRLFYLLLSSNKLKRIETYPFRDLKYLVQLALYRNNITFIAEGSLQNTHRLTYIQWSSTQVDISQDNKLACDCDSVWLKEYILSNRPYHESVKCGYPLNLRGERLRDVNIQNCTRGLKLSVTPSSAVNYVMKGSCLELQCKANKFANVTWKRIIGGSEKPVNQNYSTHCIERHVDECGNTDNEGLLTLRNISASEQGIYVCTSTVDNVTSSEIRQIQIGEPPVIEKNPTSITARDPPPYVLFEAAAGGNPPPVLKWFHNLREINFTANKKMQMTSTGSLIILGPQFEDNGVYRLVADNGAGSVETSANLAIYFRSACNRGVGCHNGGQCTPVHYCRCLDGFTGNGCETSSNTPSPPSTPTPSPSSGDYYYSGDYYSGDYYSGDYADRKKRGVAHLPQYDYDFVDITLSNQKRAALHKQLKWKQKNKRYLKN